MPKKMMTTSKALWKARELLIRNCNRYCEDCRSCEFYSEQFCLVNVPSNWAYTDKQEWEPDSTLQIEDMYPSFYKDLTVADLKQRGLTEDEIMRKHYGGNYTHE